MTQSEFLLATIANCRANLAKPNIRYPNGRMSHDVENEVLNRTVDEFHDYALEHGRYNAEGRLVAFGGEG